MTTTAQLCAEITRQLPRAAAYPGSGQLRAGIALLRAGVRGASYLGCTSGEHRFRLADGREVFLDLVLLRAGYFVGMPS